MAANVNEVVSKMSEVDVYSVLCSFLYDLKQVPEYTTLSELCYLLDVESLMNLLKYFEGQTIKIPTKQEFAEIIQVLLLFQYYEIEKRPWKDCVKLVGLDTSSGKMAHNNLERLKATMTKYNFGNRDYK
jgi:hypothetical protein